MSEKLQATYPAFYGHVRPIFKQLTEQNKQKPSLLAKTLSCLRHTQERNNNKYSLSANQSMGMYRSKQTLRNACYGFKIDSFIYGA